MRQKVLHSVLVMIVVLILGGHVTELCDQWDRTLTSGQDADYSIVLLAACVGFVFVVARYIAPRLGRCRATQSSLLWRLFHVLPASFLDTLTAGLSPPPNLPLRI